MLRGDVKTTPLPDLLKRLSDAKATGCVYVQPAGKRSMEATIGLRDGAICNVMLPGAEEAIGTRLVASRRLTPADLAEAREAQETELAAWTLAELLIHLGLADEQTVHGLVLEQALAALTDLCEWPSGSWRFRRRERTGPSLPAPLEITAALETVAERQARWATLAATIHSADAVVALAVHHEPAEDDPNLEMDADAFALLCAVDGAKTVSELASSNGFTVLEAADKITELVESGLVQVAHPSHDDLYDDESDEESAADAAEAVDTADTAGAPPRGLAAIAAAFAVDIDNDFPHAPIGAPWQRPRIASGDSLADALARVSAALSDAMAEPVDDEEASEAADFTPEAVVTESAVVEPEPEVEPEVDVEVEPEAVFEPEPVVVVEEQEAEVEAELEAALEVEPEGGDELAAEDEEYLAAVITLPFAAAEPEVEVEVEVEAEAEAEAEPEVVEPEVEAESAEFVAEPEQTAEVESALEIEPVAEPNIEEALEAFAALASTDEEIEPAVEHAELVDHTETAHESRATAANAARLLSQFSEESATPPAAEPEPEPEAPPAAPESHAPRPRRENGFADTAALLRELSSLGTETSALSAPRMPASRPPAQPAANGGQHARKRKGLFGRS